MELRRLDELKRWFDAYTSRFFGPDEYVNAHLRSKQEHTRRTCAEILYLAGQLALDEDGRRIAEAVALLHDVGRFPQFAKYRTYNDLRSVNHGCLGAEVLHREGILEGLAPQEQEWVSAAVAHHGRKSMPADLNGQGLLFLKLIRDADKLDIFRQVRDYYRKYHEDPARFPIESELPDEPRCSPDVLEALERRELIEYSRLRTLNDMRLCQLGWVYDMNFPASLARLREQGALTQILACLPATPDIDRVRDRILGYVAERIDATS